MWGKVLLSQSVRESGDAPGFSESLWYKVAFELQVREESVLSKKGVRYKTLQHEPPPTPGRITLNGKARQSLKKSHLNPQGPAHIKVKCLGKQ